MVYFVSCLPPALLTLWLLLLPSPYPISFTSLSCLRTLRSPVIQAHLLILPLNRFAPRQDSCLFPPLFTYSFAPTLHSGSPYPTPTCFSSLYILLTPFQTLLMLVPHFFSLLI